MTPSKRHKQFLAEFDRGDTHKVLAERYGVSKDTVRNWLKAAGRDPGSNVQKRREERQQALMRKLQEIYDQTGQRELAKINLAALAKRHNVKPLTLAHYAERTGHYTPRGKVNLRAGRPRRLPARTSPQGRRLAQEVEQACAPWEPRTIAGLLRAP